MLTKDDWFHEPAPAPTLNELYTRRLVAWGYLLTDKRTCSWEVSSAYKLYGSLLTHYLAPIQRQLNEDLIFDLGRRRYGHDWTRNPEGPA
jgi:hypothetical protein